MFLRGIISLLFVVMWTITIAKNSTLFAEHLTYFRKTTLHQDSIKVGTPYTRMDSSNNNILKTVKITKERDISPLSSTQSVQQLSSKQLESSNSLNVADAIKGFSGVQIRDYGGIGGMKTIDVRGLGSKHTAVFYDGLAINDAQSGEVDLSKFSIDNLQSISLYQNNHEDIAQPARAFASASALYLQSKAAVFKEGKQTNIRAKMSGGSFGLINPYFALEQKITTHTSLIFNTEWLKANGEYDFHYKNTALLDTIIRRKNTDIETFKIEGIAQGMLIDSSQWRVNGYAYFSERGLPGPAVSNKYYTQDRQWDENIFVQGFWDKKVKNFYQLKVSGKYTYNWLKYLDPTYSNTAGKLDNRYQQDEVYLSAINVFQLSQPFKVALSTDYLYNTLDASLMQFAYPKRSTGLVNFAADYQSDNWRIQGNLLSTFLSEKVKIGPNATSKNAFSPSLSFSWKPFKTPVLHIRSSYKSIFRMPSFNDSYYTFIGSTTLKPEYAQEYNIGFSLHKQANGWLKDFTLKADAYHNQIKDKITAIPKNFRWTMFNIGEVEISGVDIGIQGNLEFSSILTANFSINSTFQKAVDKTIEGNFHGENIPYSPRSSSSASSQFYYRSWIFGTSLLYSGDKYISRLNIPSNILDSWLLQDFSISYKFKLISSQLKMTAEVNNLYNTDYVILNNYPMPGRNFRLGLHLTL